jgi:short-subunit dehydrogenase
MDEGSEVKITNVYPYIFDSDLFSGFSGFALNIIPMLKTEEVAEVVYSAIVNDQLEVYIPWYSYWMCVFMLLVPSVELSIAIR